MLSIRQVFVPKSNRTLLARSVGYNTRSSVDAVVRVPPKGFLVGRRRVNPPWQSNIFNIYIYKYIFHVYRIPKTVFCRLSGTLVLLYYVTIARLPGLKTIPQPRILDRGRGTALT